MLPDIRCLQNLRLLICNEPPAVTFIPAAYLDFNFKVVCLIGSVFIPEFHSVGSGGERMSSCYGLFLVTPIIGPYE